jgi:hypothetical protein
VEGADHQPHIICRQTVVDGLAIAFWLDEAIPAQASKVLRDRTLPHQKHRFLAFAKKAKDQETKFVRE